MDVAQFNGFEAWQLQKLGVLQSYKSPEAKNYSDSYKNPVGYWTTIYANYLVLGFNPKMVSPPDVPKKWEDLLLPKWKGDKLALDRDNAVWYSGLALYSGQEKADKFMRPLADQQPTMRKGHTLIATPDVERGISSRVGLRTSGRGDESEGVNTIEWIPLAA